MKLIRSGESFLNLTGVLGKYDDKCIAEQISVVCVSSTNLDLFQHDGNKST